MKDFDFSSGVPELSARDDKPGQLEILSRLSERRNSNLSRLEPQKDSGAMSAVHYTISEDRCGTQDAVIQAILAPLRNRDIDKCPLNTLEPFDSKFRDNKSNGSPTLQDLRPEKCSVLTCEYHKTGFARKYDCDRHTLTHYQRTMICCFCSRDSVLEEFTRVDLFKLHLAQVHGVERFSSSRRRHIPALVAASSDMVRHGLVAGSCSICSNTFGDAQCFYDLDDCVIRVIRREKFTLRNTEWKTIRA